MPVLIQFPNRESRLSAIDILADAEETYHGVPTGAYLVSDSAAKLLEARGVSFKIVGDKDKESVHAAGS